MRTIRIYHPLSITPDSPVFLTEDAANHVGRVLRMQAGDPLQLFNGDGANYDATILEVNKKHIKVHIGLPQPNPVESPLHIHLGQGISRGDRMDFAIQKAVELGVNAITPLFTERCGVKLDAERLIKRTEQWQKIAISACEQSGRSVVPTIFPAVPLKDWLSLPTNALRLTLDPRANATIKTLPYSQEIHLVIGPEGGFTETEIVATAQAGFTGITLGPRILRTETAALTAISALQLQFGDLA